MPSGAVNSLYVAEPGARSAPNRSRASSGVIVFGIMIGNSETQERLESGRALESCKGMKMEQPGLHGRHRDKNGQISKKHGNTLVSTLRELYGPSFAEGFGPHEKLAEVLAETGDRSLSQLHMEQLHKDHDAGHLEQKIFAAEA